MNPLRSTVANNVRRVLSDVAETLVESSRVAVTRTAADPLGAEAGGVFKAAPRATLPRIALPQGVEAIAKDVPRAYAFPPEILNGYRQLFAKVGVTTNDETLSKALTAILIRDGKSHTAGFVEAVVQRPEWADQLKANLATWNAATLAQLIPENLTPQNLPIAIQRLAFLPFWPSKQLADGLTAAMQRDLAASGQRIKLMAQDNVPLDIAFLGQGPSGGVLASRIPSDVVAGVISGDPTFARGSQWYLNSPNRATNFEFGGPGKALNAIGGIVSDADLSGSYYAPARTIYTETTGLQHVSETPILNANVTGISRDPNGGYVIADDAGDKIRSNIVVLPTGLGDKPKPFASADSTNFVNAQYDQMRQALAAAKQGDASGLRSFPRIASTLDFFEAQQLLNNPLAPFAPQLTRDQIKNTSAPFTITENGFRFDINLDGSYRIVRDGAGGGDFKNADEARRIFGPNQPGNREQYPRVTAAIDAIAQGKAPNNDVVAKYLERALYKYRPDDAVKPEDPAQQVVAAIGLGDSTRTALEAVTGFGTDVRAVKQLNIVPKLLWFVGENGPRDCAEFYVGGILKGFSALDDMLKSFGSDQSLASLIAKKIFPEGEAKVTPDEAIRRYLGLFEQLISVKKPQVLFNDLLPATLTQQQKDDLFQVFLKKRDAVRPRYNSLVIPIEKGQIELVTQRISDVTPVQQAGQPDRVLLRDAKGNATLADYVLDGRGNVNDTPKILRDITGTEDDPFKDPQKFELVEAEDPMGNRRVIGKRLKGEDIYYFGPQSGVITNSGTNVGANTVSLFLNVPINTLSGDALAAEALLRIKNGQLGTAAQRSAQLAQIDQKLADSTKIISSVEDFNSERMVDAPRQIDDYLRSPLDRDPTEPLARLNEIFSRIQNAPPGLSISLRKSGSSMSIQAPEALQDELVEWASQPAVARYLRSAFDAGQTVNIARQQDGAGFFVPQVQAL